jgi:hypothetical protein
MDSANSEPGSNQGGHHANGSLSELYQHWRYLIWLLGLALVIGLFYGEENWRGYHKWQNYKTKMAARGEQFDPGAFVPRPVPDEQNFAMTPALAPLYEFIPGTQKWRDPNAPQLFKDLSERLDSASNLVRPHHSIRVNSWVTSRTDLNLWAAAFAQPLETKPRRDEPLIPTNFNSKDAAAHVLEGLSDFDPVLDELRSASKRPYARFNLRYEEDNPAGILLPHLAKIKYVCRVLQLRALAHLGAGQTEEASKDLDLLFYLVDTSRGEPILISDLVRMAEVNLALQPIAEGMGQWSDGQLRRLQETLSRLDFCVDTKHVLDAERVLFGGGVIDYFRRAHNKLRVAAEFEGASGADGSNGTWPVGALFAAAPSGWLYLEQLNYNREFEDYLLPVIDVKKHEISPAAVLESDAAITKITTGTPARRFFHHEFFSSLLLPALSKSAQKVAFTQTGVEEATMACALERYRLAHRQLPDTLNQLAPEYLATLPHDIINGKPLSYRRDGDHYVLYSVGWNGSDEGGIVQHNKNGEADQKEGDWVWSDTF